MVGVQKRGRGGTSTSRGSIDLLSSFVFSLFLLISIHICINLLHRSARVLVVHFTADAEIITLNV